MILNFKVTGSTVDELRAAAKQVIDAVAPGKVHHFRSFEVSPSVLQLGTQIPKQWEAVIIVSIS